MRALANSCKFKTRMRYCLIRQFIFRSISMDLMRTIDQPSRLAYLGIIIALYAIGQGFFFDGLKYIWQGEDGHFTQTLNLIVIVMIASSIMSGAFFIISISVPFLLVRLLGQLCMCKAKLDNSIGYIYFEISYRLLQGIYQGIQKV